MQAASGTFCIKAGEWCVGDLMVTNPSLFCRRRADDSPCRRSYRYATEIDRNDSSMTPSEQGSVLVVHDRSATETTPASYLETSSEGL